MKPGPTPGNRLPWDVKGLFKTHLNSLQRFTSVNGCYAHSAIPALAFRLATLIANVWGGAFSPFSDDSSVRRLLPAYLATHDEETQRKLYTRDFWSVHAANSMHLSVLRNAVSGLVLIKEAVICNIDWLIFIVISILLDILWGVSESSTTKIK
jgi:hypothetical protein